MGQESNWKRSRFLYLTGLRQKLSPNKTQTSDIRSKHVPIMIQPIKKTKRLELTH